MFKNVTIGQHYPGDSIIHRLDPRVKILLTIVYMVLLFMVKNFSGYAVFAAFMVSVIIVSGVPMLYVIRGMKSLLFIIAFTAAIGIFMTPGAEAFRIPGTEIIATYEGLNSAAFMVIRLALLIMGTSMLTLTSSPIALTDGIEHILSPFKRIGIPAHELAMMMTIAIRFIPTLLEETEKIMKAQTARGADFESGNIFKRAKALVPLLVPLFISSFRRADELAMAMECRCYNGGVNRTRLKQLKIVPADMWCFAVTLVALAAGVALRYVNVV